ncbi:hypothetical protein E2C01_065838 [Portunus trituberculatus]|uniref:Uncharacterized protein n=1 Tax=Portunus trituberculatus TaxID=210409 RepID=A0A5B7HGN0_PORTR|nr:hypothetical protein [Portunus trituberculatus]
MSPKTFRLMTEDEDSRGSSGCFGWFFKLFTRKKRKRHHKHKDAEPSLTPVDSDTEVLENNDDESGNVPSIYLQNKRVTEINEGNVSEENGLTKACSNADAAEDAPATKSRMSACQRRRARRKALAAAKKASAENEAVATVEESRSTENEEVATVENCDDVTEAHTGTSATRRRRARRKGLTAKIKSEDRLATVRTEEQSVPDRMPLWPSPSVRVFGSDGRPFVTTWEEAAYGAFHAQRCY